VLLNRCTVILTDLFPASGDQLAIGKETARRLGMGTNMYPSSALLRQNKDESIASLPIDELIEKADGFAGVFPGTTMQITCFLLLLFDRLNSSSASICSTYV
jgi:hypothetical protein